MGEKRLPELALCIFSNKNRMKKALHERNSTPVLTSDDFAAIISSLDGLLAQLVELRTLNP